jgi:hypothetical protein
MFEIKESWAIDELVEHASRQILTVLFGIMGVG